MASNGKSDEDSRKLFIGGLPTAATKEDVQTYFETFGVVDMCTIKTDAFTGMSRGFGFLIFRDASSVTQVLGNPPHEICGKAVDPKLATPQQSEAKPFKVFLGGLDKSTTEDDIKAAFSQRGNVTEVFLPFDKEKQEYKGFAFVTFDDSDLVQTLCRESKVHINGKECDVKAAKNKNESRGGMRGGGRGGFGRGDYGGGYGGAGYAAQGYDQYGYGGQQGYQGGYGGQTYGGYDQYGGGGYGQGGYGGGYSAGYDGSSGYSGGQDQYKMKGGRGRGSYNPY